MTVLTAMTAIAAIRPPWCGKSIGHPAVSTKPTRNIA
jgi:hypothetical protein